MRVRQSNSPGDTGAFSLLELLLVATILVVLSMLMMREFGPSAHRKEMAACRSNLQKIYLALSLYRGDNGTYPTVQGATSPAAPLSLLVPKCTTVTEIFICPSSGDNPLPEGEHFAERRISYAYYMGRATNDAQSEILMSDCQIDNAPKKQGELVFSLDGKKPGNNHEKAGGNLLFTDGNVIESGPKLARDLLFRSPVVLLNP